MEGKVPWILEQVAFWPENPWHAHFSSAGQELEETSQVDWLAEAVFIAAQVLPLQ